MMLLAENCDQCIQTIIIDWLKTKTDMMKHVLTKFEQKDVLKKPTVFQLDGWFREDHFHFGT